MSGDNVVALPHDLEAPARARSWFAARAGGLSPALVDVAQLVISELVTNAVRYGRPTITLLCRIEADAVHVEVRDEGEGEPALPDGHPDPHAASGRGLLIVAATTRDWGVRDLPGRQGKSVWAVVGQT